jgi:hypothetical protein
MARYPPAMSSTVDANDSTPESFSGLLDRLTRRGRHGNAHSDFASEFAVDLTPSAASKFDSEFLSGFDSGIDLGAASRFSSDHYSSASSGAVHGTRSGRRSAVPTRSVLPVTELKPTKGTMASGSALLSYEQALRLHSRHSRTPDSNLPEVKAPSSGKNSDPAQTQVRSGDKKTSPKSIPKAIADLVPARTSAPRAVDAQPAQARVKTLTNSRTAAQAPSAPHRKSQGKTGQQAATRKTPQKNRKEKGSKARENRKLELQHQNLQLGQRRSILSIRLSECESDQLRSRAAECGLSVSAYMRSCVLDAEDLRAQVKQALAEMRAFRGQTDQTSLPPLAARSETQSHALGAGSGFEERRTWFRPLAKSAAALLGLWLPFRRGA